MKKPARSALLLALVVAGMFGFGYALVPMYSVICKLTGLNGRSETLTAQSTTSNVADANRLVTVQFVTTVNGGRTWQFRAEQPSVQVHPGEATTVYFNAKNEADRDVVGQAVPSVAPWAAANHLHKTECFCFNRQPFKAGEDKRMPVRFTIDPALPPDVDTVTLSYTFFDVSELAQRSAQPAGPAS